MPEHAPEPWTFEDDEGYGNYKVRDASGVVIAHKGLPLPKTAMRRAALCVTWCVGKPTKWLEEQLAERRKDANND